MACQIEMIVHTRIPPGLVLSTVYEKTFPMVFFLEPQEIVIKIDDFSLFHVVVNSTSSH